MSKQTKRTGSMPAEAHAGGGRARGDVECEQRDHEGGEVGEQVRRVGEDRQRVRHEAAHHFDAHKDQTENTGAHKL